MRKSLYVLGIATALGLSTCDVINPEEPIPAYVHIPSFSVQTTSDEGSASHRITEVWLTANDQVLGAYNVPATIPILEEGPSEIRLQAGIRDNGITLDPNIYPFYGAATFAADLQPGEIDTLSPVVFQYAEETQFAFIDDFEDALLAFEGIQRTETQAFEGNFSGLIELDSATVVARAFTTVAYGNLTVNSPQVYVEMNYLSDVPVAVGIAGQPANPIFSPVTLEAGFLPSDTWNKIYFSLGGVIQEGQYSDIQIVLEAFLSSLDQLGPDGKARVYLDNIKLVHF